LPVGLHLEGKADTNGSSAAETHSSRFVGDLNPEGVFIEAISPTSARDLSNRGGVGVWEIKSQSDESANFTDSSHLKNSPFTSILSQDPAVSRVFLSHLHDQCLSCLPSAVDFNALQHIYLRKIHPIFPILSQIPYDVDDISPSTVIIKQAICLAASMDPDAAPYLRFLPDGLLLTHRDFSHRLSNFMRLAQDIGLITDKVVLIQSCAILAFYVRPINPSEADLPALLSSRAVSYVQTLGLHLASNSAGNESTVAESLFCAIWALDRLSAAFYGRPVLMHERDIGRDLDVCFKRQYPCFQLFLNVIRWLDKIICLYRPRVSSVKSELTIEFPSFEDLILTAGATGEESSILGMSPSLWLDFSAQSISNDRGLFPCGFYFIVPILLYF
jgi:hypothetical protein